MAAGRGGVWGLLLLKLTCMALTRPVRVAYRTRVPWPYTCLVLPVEVKKGLWRGSCPPDHREPHRHRKQATNIAAFIGS